MPVAIHVTHEAIQKFGGIGTVLHGLVTTGSYQKMLPRTLLYSPLFHRDGEMSMRLGEDAEVLYSGLDNYDGGNWRELFKKIENEYGIHIIYGKKKFRRNHTGKATIKTDIVAVDIWNMKPEKVNQFKFKLWEEFKIPSDQFAHDSDYEQYLRIGAVLRDIFEALYGKEETAVVFSHEYMGMASALSFEIDKKTGRRNGDITIFYAHEVSTARLITEHHSGHDLAFYNIMRIDRNEGISLEDEFGSFSSYSRNELVKCAHFLNFIFAVSDITKEEYLYLCPKADADRIKVVYNGIPIEDIPFSEKTRSMKLVSEYCETLFNFRPDYIMTHVTRLVISKAIWRDIRILYHMDEHFAKKNLKGFFILLSTLVGGGRSPVEIDRMEAEYGWPIMHREGWPDLVGTEIETYRQLEIFNSRSKRIKAVFVNQFGFDNEHTGKRVPKGASAHDLRVASDMEFGMSIYEPFGIAQLENLPYGGIPLISTICGSASLLKEAMDAKDYLAIDFTQIPASFAEMFNSKHDFISITKDLRDAIESEICKIGASQTIKILPKNKQERMIDFKRMQKESKMLGWEHVATRINEYLAPHFSPK